MSLSLSGFEFEFELYETLYKFDLEIKTLLYEHFCEMTSFSNKHIISSRTLPIISGKYRSSHE